MCENQPRRVAREQTLDTGLNKRLDTRHNTGTKVITGSSTRKITGVETVREPETGTGRNIFLGVETEIKTRTRNR